MGSINVRPDSGKLFFDFRYKNKRCREQTALDDTPANRKKLNTILSHIEAEITLGRLDYSQYFPDSPRAKAFQEIQKRNNALQADTPLFAEFAKIWMNEMQAQWRKSHREGVELVLNKHVLPEFGGKELGQITKAEILEFRSKIANIKKKNGDPLSPTRINHIITPLRMILNEAANRYDFSSPYHGIKSLKLPKTDVEPFTIDEVSLIINTVRADFKNYYIVRFFTGMRTSEIDGLQWQFIDFERRQILVRQALVRGELVYTKNDGSFRAIDMSQMVFDALQEQKKATGDKQFVFCNTQGNALYHHNVCLRVWHPLLRKFWAEILGTQYLSLILCLQLSIVSPELWLRLQSNE